MSSSCLQGQVRFGGGVLLFILASSLGGVGPVRGLRGGGRGYVPSLRYTRGLGWRMHSGAEVTESSTNKQHHLSPRVDACDASDPVSDAVSYDIFSMARCCGRR
jgi:hypothetical protein